MKLTINSIMDIETRDTSGNSFQGFPIDNNTLQNLQDNDLFCKNVLNQIEKDNI